MSEFDVGYEISLQCFSSQDLDAMAMYSQRVLRALRTMTGFPKITLASQRDLKEIPQKKCVRVFKTLHYHHGFFSNISHVKKGNSDNRNHSNVNEVGLVFHKNIFVYKVYFLRKTVVRMRDITSLGY